MRLLASASWKRLALVGLIVFCLWPPAEASPEQKFSMTPCFGPEGKCLELIVKEIALARDSVLVQAYTFSSKPIADALLKAHERGAKVQLLLDKSERQEGFTPAAMLSNAGVSVFLDGKHGAARSHVIVIDSDRVITGSLSFTRAADETDSGDLVLLHSRELAAAYTKNWHNHKNHSDPY